MSTYTRSHHVLGVLLAAWLQTLDKETRALGLASDFQVRAGGRYRQYNQTPTALHFAMAVDRHGMGLGWRGRAGIMT